MLHQEAFDVVEGFGNDQHFFRGNLFDDRLGGAVDNFDDCLAVSLSILKFSELLKVPMNSFTALTAFSSSFWLGGAGLATGGATSALLATVGGMSGAALLLSLGLGRGAE